MSDAAANRGEWIELPVSDGTTMRAYVARPESGGPHPGLLVFQEVFGVNAHVRQVTDRFAAADFVACAPELFHRTAPGFEGEYANSQSAFPHSQAMTAAGMEADVRAAYELLRADAGVRSDALACAGFCMGGRVAFVANAILPLQAAVSFYGGGIAQNLLPRTPELHAPMLFVWGGQDGHILPEHTRAVADSLRQHGKPFTDVTFSDAGHGFFCDARASYNQDAAAQAWALSLAFLKVKLGLQNGR